MNRVLLSGLVFALGISGIRAEDKSKVLVNIKSETAKSNPALLLSQFKVNAPKEDPNEPAGSPKKITKEQTPKNNFLLGLGYSSSTGIQINAELRTETISRSCTMALPNLFFQIPASVRSGAKSDTQPASMEAMLLDDPINLAGTQLLGCPEADQVGRSK
jgi:hypothetical protein